MPPGKPDKSRSLYIARQAFTSELQQSARAVRTAATVTPVETQRALTEDAYLRTAVAFEVFVTEWLVRCVSFDTTALRHTLETKASNYSDANLTGWKSLPAEYAVSAQVTIVIPRTLAHTKVRTLLNCEDDNLTIRGVADLHTNAKDYIADVRGTYVGKLSKDEAGVIDATVAIRNYLAHRSERARSALNAALRANNMPAHLRRNTNLASHDSVGRYLCTVSPSGRPRVEDMIDVLHSVARRLAPYRGAPLTLWPP